MLKKHFRPLKSEDVPFVVDAWLKGYAAANRNIKIKGGMDNHRTLILACITKYKTLICCNPEDEDQIFGFMNYFTYECPHKSGDVFVTNYIYTKELFKRMGVASGIYDELKVNDDLIRLSTHNTDSFQMFCEKKDLRHWYNPHLIFKELL